MTDLRQLLDTIWRRKLTVVGITALALAVAVVALQFVTPKYESSSTLVLQPRTANDFSFFYALDTIVPIYANAATSSQTWTLADRDVEGFPSPVSVATFRQTPIIRLTARDSDPERARATAQATTDALLKLAADGEVGIPSLKISQIELPRVASEPVYPQTGLTLGIAALLGLAFGVGAALLREMLTNRVETSEALSSAAGAPTFAEIPREPAVLKLRSPAALTSVPELRVFSEALRDLRTSLLFTQDNLGTVVVTSPEGSHGKTTVSVGLATTFARAGTRTVLVDADLRKGRIAEMLRTARTPGLSEVLHGTALEDCIRTTGIETLDLVTGGALEADPGELLMAEFPTILQELRRLYEIVVVDTTPLVPVNDARIIASSADAVLVVASAETTTGPQVRAAVDRLSMIAVRPTAVVLNNSRARSKGYYGYLAAPDGARTQPVRARDESRV